MRAAFKEYYRLSEHDADELWRKGLVVIDTNVLLKLYMLSQEAQEEVLSVLKGFEDRLWLPHQVGYEYHENRLENALRPIDDLKSLDKKVEDFENNFKSFYRGNPFIDQRKLDRAFDTFKSRVSKLVSQWLPGCPDPVNEDSILDSLTSLFDGRVGDSYDEARLLDIYKIGEERYNKGLPPGYRDKGKNDDRHRFGDLIIWLQIIEQAKKSNSDVIFVTDDCKRDWWEECKGYKLGPRRDLILEFYKETNGHKIWFYTSDRFLSYAKNKSGVTVKPKTIDEVKRPSFDQATFWGLDSVQPECSFGPYKFPFLSLDESKREEIDNLLKQFLDSSKINNSSFTSQASQSGFKGEISVPFPPCVGDDTIQKSSDNKHPIAPSKPLPDGDSISNEDYKDDGEDDSKEGPEKSEE